MTKLTTAVPTGNTLDKYGGVTGVEGWLMGRFLRTFDELIDRTGATSVLEVGAGEGVLARRMLDLHPDSRVAVLDLPDDQLVAEWGSRSLSGVQGDGAHLPVHDAAVDLVVAAEVLEHVQDPDCVLDELRRASRRHVLVSVPLEPLWRVGNVARGRYLRDLGNTPGHLQHWTRRAFVATVARHLEVVAVRSPLPWTLVLARTKGT